MSKKMLFAFLGLVILGALAITAYLIFNHKEARTSAEGGLAMRGERGIIITPREAKAFLIDADIERWAVVVGISDYKNNPAVTDLKYADRDAQSFYDFLVSPQGGCFKTENIQLLLNQKASVSNLRYALGTFLGKTADKDLVVIYMAGHGAPDPKKWENLYFLTYDADMNSLPNTAYPMDDLTRDLQRYIKAKKVIVITDACHSAAVSGGMIAMRGNEGHRVNDYLKKLSESREGCTFITATRAGEGSQESEKWGGGHGVFTHFLLEGLKGQADRNSDGFITIKEAYDYLYPKVQRESENGQSPFASVYLDNSIPMGICEPEKLGIISRLNPSGIKIDKDILHYSVGLTYLESKDYKKAIESLKEAIRLKPNDAGAYYWLGFAYAEIENYQKAIESYKEVVRLNPDFVYTYDPLGSAYFALNDYEKAIESFKEAIRINPDNATVYSKLGIAYAGIKEYQKAIESCKEAIRLTPDSAQAHYFLGVAYNRIENYQKAMEPFKEAIRLNPGYAAAHCDIGRAYAGLKNYEKAMESFKESIRLYPDYAEAHYNLGLGYLLNDDRGSALDEYNILKGLDKEKANELFNLIYEK